MNELVKRILENEGVVSVVAQGENFPHMVNNWNSFLKYEDNLLFLPVGGMNTMEEILKKDNRVIVALGSKEVDGLNGPGSGAGCIIEGTAQIRDDIDEYKNIKSKFEWARAVMQIDISHIRQTT